MKYENKPFQLQKVGGSLSLDFINTANFRGSNHYQEWIQTVDDLPLWAEFVGLDADSCLELEKGMNEHKALEEVRALREAMYRIAICTLRKAYSTSQDLNQLNKWLKRANEHLVLKQLDNNDFVETYENARGVEGYLYPIVHSFSSLLSTNQLRDNGKQCSSEVCQWLFIDKTKNKSKQWCSMEICGNREKAKRYYQSNKKK